MFFHDVWNEDETVLHKEIDKSSMSIEASIHYYKVISHSPQAATLNFLVIDLPVLSWHLIDNSDQFGRQLDIFIKEKHDLIEYRFSINQPFAIKSSINSTEQNHDIIFFAINTFADIPLRKEHHRYTRTGYAFFFNYNFGPNYLRNIRIINVAKSDANLTAQRVIIYQ